MQRKNWELIRVARVPDNLRHRLDAFNLPPTGAAAMLPSLPNPAAWAVERLGEAIAAFEKGLSDKEEVGGVIVGAPGNIVFHIHKFYTLNKDILVFEGVNEHGKPQQLVQHVTQLSILLTALPKLSDEPKRIGFLPPSTSTPTAS